MFSHLPCPQNSFIRLAVLSFGSWASYPVLRCIVPFETPSVTPALALTSLPRYFLHCFFPISLCRPHNGGKKGKAESKKKKNNKRTRKQKYYRPKRTYCCASLLLPISDTQKEQQISPTRRSFYSTDYLGPLSFLHLPKPPPITQSSDALFGRIVPHDTRLCGVVSPQAIHFNRRAAHLLPMQL